MTGCCAWCGIALAGKRRGYRSRLLIPASASKAARPADGAPISLPAMRRVFRLRYASQAGVTGPAPYHFKLTIFAGTDQVWVLFDGGISVRSSVCKSVNERASLGGRIASELPRFRSEASPNSTAIL